MKRILIISIVILFVTSACKKDFLNKKPISSIGLSEFYRTQSDFDQAIIGLYAPLRTLYGVGAANYGAWGMNEMRSDNTCFIYNYANRGYSDREQPDLFLDDANNGFVSNKYNQDFIMIGRANQILVSIDKSELTENGKANVKGQALFMRAFAYFDLVQHFGDVPLVLIPPASYEETQVGRTNKSDIYQQIIKDATEAAELLPTPDKQTRGYVGNGAAFTLLGNVYLVLSRWADAEKALRSVSGYTLLADYAAVFSPANKNNAESIFEVQYWDDPAAGMASDFAYNFLPVLPDPGVIPGFPSGSSNTYAGWNTPTPDLIAAFDVNDKRREVSIGFYTGGQYTNIPYARKFVHGAKIAPNTNDNWPVYRYAEVLLLLAEALNEQGRTGESLTYLNMVHAGTRTGLPPLDITDQSSLRQGIRHERQVELAFENKRWTDLTRWGIAVDVMNAQGKRIKANPQTYYYPSGVSPVPAAYNVTTERLMFPIPQREIQINPKMIQNKGY